MGSALPADGVASVTASYAAAAKSLSSSALPASTKLDVAEGLLLRADRLSPPPEPLLRQHAIFALTSQRRALAPFLARYWRLLRLLHDRNPVPLPDGVAAAAARSFRVETSPSEKTECVDALSALLASRAIRMKLDTMAPVIAAACGCLRTESARAGMHASMERLVVAMLLQYDDVQRRSASAKKVFASAFSHLAFAVLASEGVVRKAGEVALAHGLFPHVDDVMNAESYYANLYEVLRKPEKAENKDMIPQLVEFLLRLCKHVTGGDGAGSVIAEMPSVPASRVLEGRSTPTGAAGAAAGRLPRAVCIPFRLFKDMLAALMAGVTASGKQTDATLAALTALFASAAHLGVFHPRFEKALRTPSKKNRRGEEDTSLDGENANGEATIAAMTSRQLVFICTRLKKLPRAMDKSSTTDVSSKFSKLITCASTIVEFSIEVSRDQLPDLLNAAFRNARCIEKDEEASAALSSFLVDLFRMHVETRRIPELFRLLVSAVHSADESKALHISLRDPRLQEAVVASVRALPRGQAEECILCFVELGHVRPGAMVCISLLLSLVVESVDLPTLKVAVPQLGAFFDAQVSTPIADDVNVRAGLAFVQASLTSALVMHSCGASSFYEEFAGSRVFRNAFDGLAGKKPKSKRVDVADVGFLVCELRRLVALLHLTALGPVRDDAKEACRELLGKVFVSFSQLAVREDDASVGNAWVALFASGHANWRAAVLHIVGSLVPLFDFLLLDGGEFATPALARGLDTFLSSAVSISSAPGAFRDLFLETKVGRMLTSSRSPSDKEDDIFRSSRQPHLDMQTMHSSRDESRHAQPSTPSDAENSSVKAIRECSRAILRASAASSFPVRKASSVDAEHRVHRAVKDLVTVFRSAPNSDRLCISAADLLPKLTVAVTGWAIHGDVKYQQAYLHALAVLVRIPGNRAVDKVASFVADKLRRCISQLLADGKRAVIPLMQRLIVVSRTLSSVPDRETAKGTKSEVESRLLGAESSRRVLHARAISAVLRNGKQPKTGVAFARSLYPNRTFALMQTHELSTFETALLADADLTAATTRMHSKASGNAFHDGERPQSAILEILDAISSVPGGAAGASLQTSLVAAHFSSRSNHTSASLRLARAALRSPHVDGDCARAVSRRNRSVVGVAAVAATADGAMALVDVTDAKVRSALEVSVGGMLKGMRPTARTEALLCCSIRAREVLKALLEANRRDLHGE